MLIGKSNRNILTLWGEGMSTTVLKCGKSPSEKNDTPHFNIFELISLIFFQYNVIVQRLRNTDISFLASLLPLFLIFLSS